MLGFLSSWGLTGLSAVDVGAYVFKHLSLLLAAWTLHDPLGKYKRPIDLTIKGPQQSRSFGPFRSFAAAQLELFLQMLLLLPLHAVGRALGRVEDAAKLRSEILKPGKMPNFVSILIIGSCRRVAHVETPV